MIHPYSVLVPVSGSPASLEAVQVGCTLARARKGTVTIVHVIEVARRLPLDANLEAEARMGEQVLRKAEDVARKLDFPVTGVLLQAREPGRAIVEEAADRNADLIVMGVGPSKLDGSLGNTASHVLRVAPAQVMILRQATGAAAKAHPHAMVEAG